VAYETIGSVGLPVRFFTFFNVFYVFFQNPKKHDFLRFFELPHTFSRALVIVGLLTVCNIDLRPAPIANIVTTLSLVNKLLFYVLYVVTCRKQNVARNQCLANVLRFISHIIRVENICKNYFSEKQFLLIFRRRYYSNKTQNTSAMFCVLHVPTAEDISMPHTTPQ